MNLWETVKVAWEGIASNKVRSLLTMLGIIIGVAAVIVMVAISAGTEATIEEQITGLGSNLVFVTANFSRGGPGPMGQQESSGGLVYDDAFAIAEKVKGVVAVVVEQWAEQTVKAGNITLEDVAILGTTPGFPSVRDMQVDQGRYFKQEEVDQKQKVAVLGYSLAQELFGESDPSTGSGQSPIGQTVTVGNTKLAVIGVMAEKGLVGDTDYDSRLYTPITVVFQKFTPSMFARIMGDRVRVIYVKIENREAIEDTVHGASSSLTRMVATRPSSLAGWQPRARPGHRTAAALLSPAGTEGGTRIQKSAFMDAAGLCQQTIGGSWVSCGWRMAIATICLATLTASPPPGPPMVR